MATVVARTGIKRESGFLYYLDKQGDISRVSMARGGGRQQKSRPAKVTKAGVTREDGFLYFIDKHGNVCRTKMARRGGAGRKRKVAKRRKAAPRRKKATRKKAETSRICSSAAGIPLTARTPTIGL